MSEHLQESDDNQEVLDFVNEALASMFPPEVLKELDPSAVEGLLTMLEGKKLDEVGSEEVIAEVQKAVQSEQIASLFFGRKPIRNEGPRTGRNDPCPCGSGQKYKKCCIRKDQSK